MQKIIEYATVVVSSGSVYEMDEQVNKKIAEGFQPYGYPCMAGSSAADGDEHRVSDYLVIQAMVKYGK